MNTPRTLLVISLLVSLALLSLPALPAGAKHTEGGRTTSRGQLEEGAGAWRTWVLTAGSQLRLPPPPARKDTRAEIDELKALVDQRDAAALDLVRYWDTGAPAYRWNELALQRLPSLRGANGQPGVAAFRGMALLSVAIYDATVAAWDTKYAYRRPRPSEFNPSLPTALPTPDSPAYPSEHAVVAGAASAMLGYLFPAEATTLAARAEEAGRSRLLAGTDYPSDVAAGLELGRAVAALVIERAKTDGADQVWPGSVPTGPGVWTGTDPADPQAAHWRPWVLTSGSQFRSGPPPTYDSERMAAELAEVKTFPRTFATNRAAYRWAPTSALLWPPFADQKIFEYRLDVNPPRAARVYALTSIAAYDGLVAAMDTKYTYWAIRPHQLDPTITTVIPVPPHPSYPSGHAVIAGAALLTLAALFPPDAAALQAQVDEMAISRLWAGIHFRSDIEAGLAMARAVSQAVMERANSDGSQ